MEVLDFIRTYLSFGNSVRSENVEWSFDKNTEEIVPRVLDEKKEIDSSTAALINAYGKCFKHKVYKVVDLEPAISFFDWCFDKKFPFIVCRCLAGSDVRCLLVKRDGTNDVWILYNRDTLHFSANWYADPIVLVDTIVENSERVIRDTLPENSWEIVTSFLSTQKDWMYRYYNPNVNSTLIQYQLSYDKQEIFVYKNNSVYATLFNFDKSVSYGRLQKYILLYCIACKHNSQNVVSRLSTALELYLKENTDGNYINTSAYVIDLLVHSKAVNLISLCEYIESGVKNE